MKTTSFLAIAFTSLIFIGQAWSAEIPTWEFTGATSGTFTHLFGNSNHDAANTAIVSIGADYFILPQLELGTRTSFFWESSPGATLTETVLTIGPTFNFSTDTANSPFLSIFVGLEINHLASDSTFIPFRYFIGVGKRFQIVDHVSWSPEIALVGRTSASDSSGFTQSNSNNLELIPFQFSLLF